MAVFVVSLALLVAMTCHYSDATYCICNGDYQKNIDYACGAGADCSAILEKGACYNPNTIKDHCNYAVNSYFQRKGQVNGSCDFSGTAAPSQTVPSAGSGCVYQSSPSSTGGTTPSTTIGGGTTNGTTLTPGGIGISPSGPGFDNTGSGSASVAISFDKTTAFMLLFLSFTTFLISCPRI